MKIDDTKKITIELLDTFLKAGDLSLELREKGLIKEIKEDNTPVTNGDLEVNKILINKISILTPEIPIISEENSKNKDLKNLNDFWLIDPIDGTFDYINQREEFTINAALIINRKPIIGVINAPAKKRLFYSFAEKYSYELKEKKEIILDCTKRTSKNEIRAVSYSDKLKPIISDLHKKEGVTEYTKMKSSLKFCVIAAGEYDLYVAEPRASEWDIAAGHAILKNAGGIITDLQGNEIEYGKKDFKNPGLILKRSKAL